jgi:hypothetical protein
MLRFNNLEAIHETEAVLKVIFEALETPLPNPLREGARGWRYLPTQS